MNKGAAMNAIPRTAVHVLVATVTLTTLAAQSPDPRVGQWTLNVAKSKYNPGPAPKSQTLTVEATAQGEKVTSDIVNADGTHTNTQYSAAFDGKEYPLTGSPTADSVMLKRIDGHSTERVDKKAGKVVQTFRRVVSKDGRTMTVTTTGTNAKGQAVNNVIIFEKR
jgi:hypothetical protein